MSTPDWHHAGTVVQSVIDTLDLGTLSQESLADYFELSVERLVAFLDGTGKGTPWRQTVLKIDAGLIKAGVPGWYMGRTRKIARNEDRPPGLHVLTEEEWEDVKRKRYELERRAAHDE